MSCVSLIVLYKDFSESRVDILQDGCTFLQLGDC